MLDNDTIYTFFQILGIMTVIGGAAFVLAVVLMAIGDRLSPGDLHDVFAREGALDALERMHQPREYGRCYSCDSRILVENTYQGLCSDCYLDREWHADQVAEQRASDQEWADLWAILDDEAQEQEDHR